MSAGAQHGATCCYGDRQAPSDQQLLTCSCRFSFLFLFFLTLCSPCSAFLVSSPPSSQLHLLIFTLSSSSPSLFSPIFLLSVYPPHSPIHWESKLMAGPGREWTHLSRDTRTCMRTQTHTYTLILVNQWRFPCCHFGALRGVQAHVFCAHLCVLECVSSWVHLQVCVCMHVCVPSLLIPSDMLSQQFSKD